jgi:hypothetical protein
MKLFLPKTSLLIAIAVAAGMGSLLAYGFGVQPWLAGLIGFGIGLLIQAIFSIFKNRHSF